MIIAGAGGHARELLGILDELHLLDGVSLFDDRTGAPQEAIWDTFPVITSSEGLHKALADDNRFIIGVGNPGARKLLCEKLTAAGGQPFSLISPHARIGNFNVVLGQGLNIMTNAVITEDVYIGKGTLVHIAVTIHHDCRIGAFCELSPGCHLLGGVTVGDGVSVGSGAVILPGVQIGKGARIGAGGVVTKDVSAGVTVKGIPAQ